MRRPLRFDNLSVRALASVAILAPVLTYALVAAVVLIADPPGTGGSGSTTGWIAAGLAQIGGMVAASIYAVILGFGGAFVFLACTIGLLPRTASLLRFVLTGAAAGLAHWLCGFCLLSLEHLVAAPNPAGYLVGAVGVLGGFALMSLSRTALVATLVAAPVAGAVSGWLYAILLAIEEKERANPSRPPPSG